MDSANLVKVGDEGTRFRRQELCLRRILKVVVASIKLLQPPLSSFFTKNKTQNLNQKRERERENRVHGMPLSFCVLCEEKTCVELQTEEGR
ncbi:hypothetical protein Bca4012_020477 [Brassica carinata]|uniref:Uncharacterized protein n=1 Tax=Brassica carinata TaxID=52824 RepID=A0A8X8BCU6_BRACI|nr:hypothetical protein Bca52824_001172 [Brassica carinata]